MLVDYYIPVLVDMEALVSAHIADPARRRPP